jgi:hypothetical protein
MTEWIEDNHQRWIGGGDVEVDVSLIWIMGSLD